MPEDLFLASTPRLKEHCYRRDARSCMRACVGWSTRARGLSRLGSARLGSARSLARSLARAPRARARARTRPPHIPVASVVRRACRHATSGEEKRKRGTETVSLEVSERHARNTRTRPTARRSSHRPALGSNQGGGHHPGPPSMLCASRASRQKRWCAHSRRTTAFVLTSAIAATKRGCGRRRTSAAAHRRVRTLRACSAAGRGALSKKSREGPRGTGLPKAKKILVF